MIYKALHKKVKIEHHEPHETRMNIKIDWFDFWCFNATFSSISSISWLPVLVVEEAGVPGENHRPLESNWSILSLAAASGVHPFM
jgi:hypothetical protein